MTELPKQELLLKLLGLTASACDAEALAAIRKANEFMLRAGWTWEMLLHSKIKIIPNPFEGLTDPRARRDAEGDAGPFATPSTPAKPSQVWRATSQTPPHPSSFQQPKPQPSQPQKPQMGPQNAGPLPRRGKPTKYRPSAGEL